jgi:hypothetical protein
MATLEGHGMIRANMRFVLGGGLLLGGIIAAIVSPDLVIALGVLGLLWGAVEDDSTRR